MEDLRQLLVDLAHVQDPEFDVDTARARIGHAVCREALSAVLAETLPPLPEGFRSMVVVELAARGRAEAAPWAVTLLDSADPEAQLEAAVACVYLSEGAGEVVLERLVDEALRPLPPGAPRRMRASWIEQALQPLGDRPVAARIRALIDQRRTRPEQICPVP